MRKKFIAVYALMAVLALGSTALTSCVDDNESASVTAIRDAKANQLNALAKVSEAEASAKALMAEADAALKKAKAEYQAELTEESRAKFEAELEALKAEYEARIAQAKKEAKESEQALLDLASERIQNLYKEYSLLLNELNQARTEKIEADVQLTQYKSSLITAQTVVTKETAQKMAQIEEDSLQIEAWKTYGGINKADIQLEKEKLVQEQYTAFAELQAKKDAEAPLKEKANKEVLNNYDVNKEGESNVSAVQALKDYQEYKGDYSLSVDEATISRSVSKKLASWSDFESYYDETSHQWFYSIKASKMIEVWENGERYIIVPVVEEEIAVSEDVDLNVIQYGIRNESVTTAMNQYYAEYKSNLEKQLGSPASADKLATGLYLTKENNEKALAEAKEALTKAEEEFPKAEKAYKTASDALDTANKDVEAKEGDVTAADKAVEAAQKALEEAQKGGDADAIQDAQDALDDAIDTQKDAQKALSKSQEAQQKAQEAKQEAESDYWSAQNDVETASKANNEAEIAVSNINDQIAETKDRIANWDAEKGAWEKVVTELQSEAYGKAISGLSENKTVADYIAAKLETKAANKAYKKAQANIGVLDELLASGDVKDPAAEIRQLEVSIAQLYQDIDNLKATSGQNQYEELVAIQEATIQGLESEIEVLEKRAEYAKKRVEEAIKAEESDVTIPETPEEGNEETPAE